MLARPRGLLAVVLALPLWFWFFCRIEPGPGEIAVLIRKTGKELPSGQILALEKGARGTSLSGTGPSYAALIDESKMDGLEESWRRLGGRVIRTKANNRCASRGQGF